jgi:pimeloyl-ACP methyl ester carboxylesterase
VDAEERGATIDGTSMRWLERGQGPVVVLVHGIPTSPALWRHVLPLVGDARPRARAAIEAVMTDAR